MTDHSRFHIIFISTFWLYVGYVTSDFVCNKSEIFQIKHKKEFYDRNSENSFMRSSYDTSFLSENIEFYSGLKPYLIENYPLQNVSEQCTKSLLTYWNALREQKEWALEMLDATAKPPSSIFSGTNLEFGSFDDCLQIKSTSDASLFNGKFCLVRLKHPLFQPTGLRTPTGNRYVDSYGEPPDWVRTTLESRLQQRFGLYLGVCFPSTCSEQDLYNIIHAYVEPEGFSVSLTDCQTNEPKQWPTSAKVAIFSLTCVLFMCIIGTALDIFDQYYADKKSPSTTENFVRDLLKTFSVYTQTNELFDTSNCKTGLDFIYGLRTFLCLWVVAGHSFVYPTPYKELHHKNMYHVFEVITPELTLFNNGLVMVDGFFFVSSFLVFYLSWKKLEKSGGKLDIFETIQQRYWRVTPAHLFMIITSFALPVFGSGPIWNSSWQDEVGKCKRNGWKNILFLQNFDGSEGICWLHTWWLAVAFQTLFIILPLLVITFKFPKTGILLGVSFMIGSIFRDYMTSISNEFLFFSANSEHLFFRILQMVSKLYMYPLNHFGTHLLGMLTGWMALKYKQPEIKKGWQLVGWILSAILFHISFYAVYLPTTDIRITGLYNSTRTTVYSLSLVWVVYACTVGLGGYFNQFLSQKIFIILSRFSYSAYLVHCLYMVSRNGRLRDRLYMDRISTILELLACVFFSTISAVIFYITVEAPLSKVYDLLKKKLSQKTKPSSTTPQNGTYTSNCSVRQSK